MRNKKNKSDRKELLDMIIQILKEQFTNIKPNKDKINRYLEERFIELA